LPRTPSLVTTRGPLPRRTVAAPAPRSRTEPVYCV